MRSQQLVAMPDVKFGQEASGAESLAEATAQDHKRLHSNAALPRGCFPLYAQHRSDGESTPPLVLDLIDCRHRPPSSPWVGIARLNYDP